MCLVLGHSHGHGGHGGHNHGSSATREARKKQNSPVNINVRAAYIHVIGDLIQSIGVVIAGYIIWIWVSGEITWVWGMGEWGHMGMEFGVSGEITRVWGLGNHMGAVIIADPCNVYASLKPRLLTPSAPSCSVGWSFIPHSTS